MSRANRDPSWITLSAGSRLLGVSPQVFPKCVSAAGIRYRQIPGRQGRLYHRADIEALLDRLAAEETTRAANTARI